MDDALSKPGSTDIPFEPDKRPEKFSLFKRKRKTVNELGKSRSNRKNKHSSTKKEKSVKTKIDEKKRSKAKRNNGNESAGTDNEKQDFEAPSQKLPEIYPQERTKSSGAKLSIPRFNRKNAIMQLYAILEQQIVLWRNRSSGLNSFEELSDKDMRTLNTLVSILDKLEQLNTPKDSKNKKSTHGEAQTSGKYDVSALREELNQRLKRLNQ